MLAAVVAPAAGHHGNVRFWLGLVVQCDRPLGSHQPSWSKGRPERVLDQPDCRVMLAALRLADDHLAAQQLDGIVGLEEAGVDQPVVLQPRPAARSERILHHRAQATPRGKTTSMSLPSDTASWSMCWAAGHPRAFVRSVSKVERPTSEKSLYVCSTPAPDVSSPVGAQRPARSELLRLLDRRGW